MQIGKVKLIQLSAYVTSTGHYVTATSTLQPISISLPLSPRGPVLQYRKGPLLRGIHQTVSRLLQTTECDRQLASAPDRWSLWQPEPAVVHRQLLIHVDSGACGNASARG